MDISSFCQLLSDPTVRNLFQCLNAVFKCDPALFDCHGKYFHITKKFRELEADVQTLTPNFTAEYVLELEYAVSEAKDATPQDKQCLQRAICAFLMYLKKNQPKVIDDLIAKGEKFLLNSEIYDL